MRIQKLEGAGDKLEAEIGFLLHDPLEKMAALFSDLMGQPHAPILPLPSDQPLGVYVNHLHGDHYDASTLLERYGADVSLHVPVEAVLTVKKGGICKCSWVLSG